MPSKPARLLEQMRRSKANWKRHDLDTLYRGFGFEIKSGAHHDIVTHPDFPQLFTALPRHTKIAKYLITQAVKLVDRLLELQKQEGIPESEANTGEKQEENEAEENDETGDE